MCTVTFIPTSQNTFVLTSNRDEAPGRDTLFPAAYDEDGVQLLYPKDAVAGGTWIGTSDLKRTVCLLNGGFTAHERASTYRMSRGVIVKHLLMTPSALTFINNFDFEGIEPFTLLLVQWESDLTLHELVWDGETAHLNKKPIKPLIWSSSLLYDAQTKLKRERWFSTFLSTNHQLDANAALLFHKTAGENNANIDLIMDRTFVKTKSITQIENGAKNINMRYEDLEQQKITTTQL